MRYGNNRCTALRKKRSYTCKSRTLTARCRLAWASTNKVAAAVCGGVLLLCGVLVRFICGSPWGSSAALILKEQLPSAFFTSLAFDAWYALLGACFGAVMFSGERSKVICLNGVYKYWGALCFLCMILLGFLWYPLFFVAARFALSALLCLAVIGLCVLCGLCFWSVSRIFGSLLLLHALYLLSLFFRLLTILVA